MFLKKSAGDFEVISFGFGRPLFFSTNKKGEEFDFKTTTANIVGVACFFLKFG